MASASSAKGNKRERELVNMLDDRGFAVMRAPASGAATERELPDVLAGNGTAFYAFEAKASNRETHIYLDEHEVTDLEFFASGFGAEAKLAIRFDYNDWAFFDPDEVYRTDGGNYRVALDDIAPESPYDSLGIDDL